MPVSKVTVDEFIEIWRTHKSPGKVAKVLGIAERNVMARRRRIEALRGINLSSDVSIPIIQDHPKRLDLGILNGKIVVFSDAHFWPGVRTTAFKALLRFIKTYKPRAVICNGDAFDGASISRFPAHFLDHVPTVKEELEACKTSMEEIEDVSGEAKLIWTLGNHDSRFENRVIANTPQFRDTPGFSLNHHFIKWQSCWSVWNCDTVIKHKWKGGLHATHNNTVNAGVNIVTGHLHSLKVTPFDDYTGTRYGVDTGTLAEPSGPQFRNYLEESPTNWRSGFVVLTFHDGRLLWPEVVKVCGPDVVEWRGEVFDVSAY
jgi:predicted phosphodiesterase